MLQRHEGRHLRDGTTTRGEALATVALALAAGLLLNAQAMLVTARGMPFGWRRDVAVTFMRPVAQVSHALWLDVPRRELDRALGHLPPSQPSTSPQPTAAPTPPATASPGHSATPSPSSLRMPTSEAPLRITVVGDSMAQAQGTSLVTLSAQLRVAQAQLDFRFSSGLARPDFFDWPSHLAQLLAAARPPEAVVVSFGANDAQGMDTPKGVLHFGTAAWEAEYTTRVAAVMRQLTADGARVYWVGQPIARSASYSHRMAVLDDIYRAQAARHHGVRYVDSWPLFTDTAGHYSAYLPTSSGPQLMRTTDGIHLTRAGGDRLARAVLAAIGQDWRLTP